MFGGEARRVLLIVVGLWPIVACCGCHPEYRHGYVLGGSWSLECNRVPWRECPGTGCPQRCSAGPGCGPDVPIQSGQADPGRSLCKAPAGRWRFPLSHLLGERARPVMVKVADQPHSRFHPVPSRPVFSPRGDLDSSAASCSAEGPGATPLPSGKDPPASETVLPAPLPEEVHPLPDDDTNRSAGVPARLRPGRRSPSWIFNPPQSRQPDSPVATAAEPKARWIRR